MMKLEMDEDVQAVAEFMQANVPAAKLTAVATSIGGLAPLLWGQFAAEEISPLTLRSLPPTS